MTTSLIAQKQKVESRKQKAEITKSKAASGGQRSVASGIAPVAQEFELVSHVSNAPGIVDSQQASRHLSN